MLLFCFLVWAFQHLLPEAHEHLPSRSHQQNVEPRSVIFAREGDLKNDLIIVTLRETVLNV